VQDAAERALADFPYLQFSICVGADGCTDGSVQTARSFGVDLVITNRRRGKWQTLSDLIERYDSFDWIALADAGAIWPQDLLLRCLPLCQVADLVALAPSYRDPTGGWLSNLTWRIESYFKKLECRAGGPVSLHGATVLYRRDELTKAITVLSRRRWLNDDVVLPLTLRLQNPEKRIVYLPDLHVSEYAPASPLSRNREFVRRRRLVIGNLEWMKMLLPSAAKTDYVVGLLALRRIFRMLWAYWGIFVFGGLLTAMASSVFLSLSVTAGICLGAVALRLKAGGMGHILAAAQASLLAPYYFYKQTYLPVMEWK